MITINPDNDQHTGTHEHHFRAMGSQAHVVLVGGTPDLIDFARRRIEQLEQRWSRFIPTSEISSVNANAGSAVAVSDDTIALVERAIAAWRDTGGSVDATVFDAVVRAGYDRSIELVRADGPRSSAADGGLAPRGPVLAPGCTDIAIDRAERTVTLPVGTSFDPGGIGKGLAADLVAGEIMSMGADGVCVNLGGDVRVAGSGPTGTGWTVAVEHPWSTEPIALVGLRAGAVATSTTLLRTWTVDGEQRHHLIDPVTGTSSDSDLSHVTVIAGEASTAEILAKAVLLRGTARAFDILEPGVEALIVDHFGDVSATTGFAAFLGGAAPPVSVDKREGAGR
jgi:FAD:protein FMN transferase